MVSRNQEPDAGVPTGGGGNSAGPPQRQHTQGGGEGAGNERREQGGGPGGDEIPESLRAGPREGAESTNPFVRAQHTGNPPASGPEAVVNPWASDEERDGRGASVPDANVPGPRVPEANAPNAIAPETSLLDTSVPPVSSHHQGSSVTGQFQNLNIADQSSNPWGGQVEQEPTVTQPPPPSFAKEDSGNEAWSSATPPTRTPRARTPPPLINADNTHEPSNWDDNQQDLFRTPAGNRVVTPDAENVWEEAPGGPSRREGVPAPVSPQNGLMREDGGSEPTGRGEQQSGVIDAAGRETSLQRPIPSRPPNLPPRNIGDSEDARASHDEYSTGEANVSAPRQDSEGSKAKGKETYDIKKIAWFDARASENPRITPILIQITNGPCPLLALVNALTISTPPDLITPLIETLRTREQVSLELLLNAVVDELMSMSGRLDDGTQELPDITDLYTFLVTLHTGMNVNPSFFPPAATNLANDPRRSMSHVHPSEREERIPGTFEQTREIMLYGTFLIPLIHGWLPEPESAAHEALARAARTYEDTQHLLVREEDLETKFISDGLSFEEQMALDDILTIKSFLSSSKTQITEYGLETIRRALAPGSVAILFRNDHFSTLYKHPQSGELMHLVTDKGLAGHDEIVWESLPDISGENCEFYSGDFRAVGGDTQSRQAESDVDSRQRGSEVSTAGSAGPSARHQRVASSSAEQEDHDLALALQLQEEENQRHEEETARRRRESGNTQQQQGAPRARNTGNNNVPVTRFDGAGGGPRSGNGGGSSQSQAQSQSPAPQTSNPGSPGDEVLPSYEHAATLPRFEPPPNHPLHPGPSPEVPPRPQGQQQGMQAQRARPAQGRPAAQPVGGRGNRRQNQTGRNRERDKDCVVM
ncbi:hypothetical protein V502_06534 [Pseudogymnoascus sp. VKM F-4520 (FW-2644)]|nr:hypothetical protein V502_06534 [Pseudogymnoascus sp. VKM F-4520 (FW-2644)]